MANPSNPYEELIENPYESLVTGEIPKTENFIQKAINSYKSVPSVSRYAPSNLNEVKDIGRIASGITVPFTPSTLSENISEATGEPSFHQPRTEYGERVQGDIGLGVLGGLGFAGARAAGKGINSLLSKVRKFPVEKEIGALTSELDTLKKGTSEIAYSGSKKVKDTMSTLATKANEAFGEKLSNLESAMNTDDFANVLAETADEIGVSRVPGHPIMGMFEKLVTQGSKFLEPKEVNMMTRNILRVLGKDEVSKAVFYKKLTDVLESAVPGLKDIKKAHAPIFNALKAGKKITKGGLGRLAKSTAPTSEVSDLMKAGEELGTDVAKKASVYGEGIAKKGADLTAKQNRLQEIIRNQNRVKAIGWGTGVGGGLLTGASLLDKIFSD